MTVYYTDEQVTLHHGDATEISRQLETGSVDCIVTSPPYYGLRDYGQPGQYGLEETPAAYVETMRALFAELRRVLADDGTLWLNLGDSYANNSDGYQRGTRKGSEGNQPAIRPKHRTLPHKNLIGIPWRTAFALQDDGWILRNDVIWHKPNAMPASVDDRLSTRHEHVFMFSKQRFYWFDLDPIREVYVGDRAPNRRDRNGHTNKPNSAKAAYRADRRNPDESTAAALIAAGMSPHSGHRGTHEQGRNPGDVWSIPTSPFPGAHFAVFPVALPQRCILAGCKPGGTVLDPFNGSGTTGLAAQRAGRRYVGIDLSAKYLELAMRERLNQSALDFGEATP